MWYNQRNKHRLIYHRGTNIRNGYRQISVENYQPGKIPPFVYLGNVPCKVYLPDTDATNQICFRCLQPGHSSIECPNQTACLLCKRYGHIKTNCPEKTDEETARQMVSTATQKPNANTTTTGTGARRKIFQHEPMDGLEETEPAAAQHPQLANQGEDNPLPETQQTQLRGKNGKTQIEIGSENNTQDEESNDEEESSNESGNETEDLFREIDSIERSFTQADFFGATRSPNKRHLDQRSPTGKHKDPKSKHEK